MRIAGRKERKKKEGDAAFTHVNCLLVRGAGEEEDFAATPSVWEQRQWLLLAALR